MREVAGEDCESDFNSRQSRNDQKSKEQIPSEFRFRIQTRRLLPLISQISFIVRKHSGSDILVSDRPVPQSPDGPAARPAAVLQTATRCIIERFPPRTIDGAKMILQKIRIKTLLVDIHPPALAVDYDPDVIRLGAGMYCRASSRNRVPRMNE